MPSLNPDAEDALEQATVDLFAGLGWETVNAYSETWPHGILGREHTGGVVLTSHLRRALKRLNPDLPREAISLAVEELSRDRSALSMAQANREVYRYLRDGVRVSYRDEDGVEVEETVRVVDWNDPKKQ